jgi:hypothetical protein
MTFQMHENRHGDPFMNRQPVIHQPILHGAGLVLIACALHCPCARGGEAEIIQSLKDKGATVTDVKGVLSVNADCSKWTDDEYRQLGQLTRVKNVGLNKGLTDSGIALLSGLSELQTFGCNGSGFSDEGLKPMAKFKKLRNVAIFHPGKDFSGAGLAYLAELPDLEGLTVAGSFAFNDAGMAAVAKLTRLKSFRTWHAGQTNAGMKNLQELKNLKSVNLGQRLTYKPPACPTDETLAVLAEMKSLESIDLSEARLTLAALGKLKQLPALKRLTLAGVDIPEKDVELLRKELPKVEVKWIKPDEGGLKRIRAVYGPN